MNNPYYSIEQCESILRAEAKATSDIITLIAVVFAGIFIYCIVALLIKRRKKTSCTSVYIELISVIVGIVVFSFYLIPRYTAPLRDINEQAYIQYEGPAIIQSKKMVDGFEWFSARSSSKYYVSLEQNGETIELKMDDSEERGYYEKVYITYGKHSKLVIQFDIVEQ